jgi:hypothetical protein
MLFGSAAFVGALQLAAVCALALGLEQTEDDQRPYFVVGLLGFAASAPAMAGLVTCHTQNKSADHHAGCAAPVVAAYLGAAAGVYATYAIYKAASPRGWAELPALVPLVVAPSASAALTWHLLKAPSGGGRIEQTLLDARPRFERSSARGRGASGAALVLPLMAARF